MNNEETLNVTLLEPREKHPAIFARFDSLKPGESFTILNDHDPKPLYYQLMAERGNGFEWNYHRKGPEYWEVQIRKRNDEDGLTLGKLAASDFRKAQVFKKYGLDFCCGGKKTIKQACIEKGVSEAEVIKALNNIESVEATTRFNYNDWTPDFLAAFIVNNHHSYVKRSSQPLQELADKVARVHGDHYPELKRVAAIFHEIAAEMHTHMIKEEMVLFPYIEKLVKPERLSQMNPFHSVLQPVHMMEMEHEVVGEKMSEIHALTDGYTLPAGACASFTLLYKWLKEFEEDLHLHVHLENNILFPKALELEQQQFDNE